MNRDSSIVSVLGVSKRFTIHDLRFTIYAHIPSLPLRFFIGINLHPRCYSYSPLTNLPAHETSRLPVRAEICLFQRKIWWTYIRVICASFEAHGRCLKEPKLDEAATNSAQLRSFSPGRSRRKGFRLSYNLDCCVGNIAFTEN